ncbi:type I-E CRISPR-associated protein Cas5/CasD [Streptacidiphilus sp. EB103A]|jgi:CRISPR system Cascade subunit CasD|uniref:type I-E CRISPR-associated protein Cas5/CasD n=1 Tax=Streptacidiphilus sp. EB103A TaxID=3156275 RepID=UPI003518FB50
MPTLLLRLDGPMQAWGSSSMFEQRATDLHPTKSGIIGLLAAALGRPREADILDLAALRCAVRVDQPGEILHDFQIVGIDGWYSASGKVTVGQPKLSRRQYLADAVFTVAVGGENTALIEDCAIALTRPAYGLFLGRKSCPPAAPIYVTTTEQDPVTALAGFPYQGRLRAPALLRIIGEDPAGPCLTADQPVSFAPGRRTYTGRRTRTTSIPTPLHSPQPGAAPFSGGDPYELGR